MTRKSFKNSTSVCPSVFQRTQLCLAISAMLMPVWVFAAPVVGPNGGVTSGSATIVQNGPVTDINQSSNKAIINWQSFSTAPNETVNFNQPNAASITLNRVTGNEQSVLQGALNATGKVYLVNRGGVLISSGASVNTGGFVASTLDIRDEDFNNGNYTFKGNGSTAAVTNLGTITVTDGGYVVLMGHLVSNQGAIVATKGTVSLNAGNKVTLNFNGNSLLSVTIDEGALNALVENKQAIYANGGQVILTAKAADELLGSQVNNTGIVQAQTIDDLKGTIEIYAHGGTAHIAGKLDASAPVSGDGGFIETSGDTVKIADGTIITTKSASGKTGKWLIDPTDFTVGAGGDISGAQLSDNLNTTDVVIESVRGRSGTQGNINVNESVIWAADTKLTLDAVNDININAPIKATGNNAGLVMLYGGNYNIRTKASYSGTVLDANGRPVAKQDTSGGVYGSITLSGAGSTLNINNQEYTLVHSMAELAAKINGNVNPNGLYALAQDIDAAGTTYTGAVVTTLNGTLAGLGNVIRNLTIDAPSATNVGLIGQVAAGSANIVRDIGIVNANIKGQTNVGALVGSNLSTIKNSYSTGSVAGQSGVGGLVGSHGSFFTSSLVRVESSYSDASVTATGGNPANAGGLIGISYADVYASHATGSVTAGNAAGSTTDKSGDNIGGLIGRVAMDSRVDNSYAKGEVKSLSPRSSSIGGLIGNFGNQFDSIEGRLGLSNSFATGKVSGGFKIGGLLGEVANSIGGYTTVIQNVYAQGDVISTGNVASASSTTQYGVGGLIGSVSAGGTIFAHIINAYASGNVESRGNVPRTGGLIGSMFAGTTVTNSYATGNVKSALGSGGTGGLVGHNRGIIENSYAKGNVVADVGYAGGLVGDNWNLIQYSEAFGNVVGPVAGGLVGQNNYQPRLDIAVISWSKAHGDVFSTNSSSGYAGGLVGYSNGNVENSVAYGAASGGKFNGGLIGFLSSHQFQTCTSCDNGNDKNNFWNSAKNSRGIGGTDPDNPPKLSTSIGISGDQFNDIEFYLNGTIESVLAARQVRVDNVLQQGSNSIQSMQRTSPPPAATSSFVNSAPSMDSQIVFADTQNFSADVKSIVVDGVRFNLGDDNQQGSKEESGKKSD